MSEEAAVAESTAPVESTPEASAPEVKAAPKSENPVMDQMKEDFPDKELAKWAGDLEERAGKKKTVEEPEEKPEAEAESPEMQAAKKSRDDANRAYRERQEKKKQEREERESLRQQNQQYRELLERIASQPEAQQQQYQDPDPEPNPQQSPREWHEWNYRKIQNDLERRLQEPQQRAAWEHQQRAAQQQQFNEAMQNVHQELTTAEQEYAETVEGAGVHDRINTYVNELGKRLHTIGEDPSRAFASLQALLQSGAQRGENPWAFADKAIQALGYGWMNGAGQQHAAPPQQAPGNGRVAELSAAANAPESRTVNDMNSASSSGDVSIEAMAKAGKLNASKLRGKLQKDGNLSQRGIMQALADIDKAMYTG